MSVVSLQSSSQPRWLLPFLVVLVSGICLLPMLRLLSEGFSGVVVSTDSHLFHVFSDAATWNAAGHTIYTAGLSMLISVLLGAGFAFPVALSDIRGKGALVFCFMLPMMIPPQVTALSWVQLSGPSSTILNILGLAPPLGSPQPFYSAEGIALLLGVQHAAIVFLALRVSLRSIPGDMIEAARLSGASQFAVWKDIILPLSSPGLIAGAAMAFVSAVGNFGIPALLGIPVSYYVLPTLIYQKMADFGANVIAEVALLSLLVAVIAVAGVGLQYWISRKRDYRLVGLSGKTLDFSLRRWRLPVELLLWAVLSVILIAPLLALVANSLVPAYGVDLTFDNASFAAYREMLLAQGVTTRAIGNSIFLATVAALALLVFALPLAYLSERAPSRLLKVVTACIEVPYALPGVVLAIACILLFVKPLPFTDYSLYGSLGIILFAYLARFMVVSIKPIQSSFKQMDPALEEAAQLAGAGFARRMRTILMPLVAPSAFAGALLVFLIAVNELTVSALLWSAGNETIGVLIFNLDDSGDTVLASALSVVVVLMVLVLMALLEAASRKLPKGVIPWHS